MMDVWVSTKEDNHYYDEMNNIAFKEFEKNVLKPYQ
jgi:endo-1,4-beta-mannosidase